MKKKDTKSPKVSAKISPKKVSKVTEEISEESLKRKNKVRKKQISLKVTQKEFFEIKALSKALERPMASTIRRVVLNFYRKVKSKIEKTKI